MRGRSRFLRVCGGVCSFAQVEVDVAVGGEELEIVYSLSEQVDVDRGEANYRTAPLWVEAALEGIHDTLQFAREAGALAGGCRVELIQLIGTAVDTRPAAVRCAAGLALIEGLAISNLVANAEHRDGEWTLHYSYVSELKQGAPFQPVRWTYRTPVLKPEWQTREGGLVG